MSPDLTRQASKSNHVSIKNKQRKKNARIREMKKLNTAVQDTVHVHGLLD